LGELGERCITCNDTHGNQRPSEVRLFPPSANSPQHQQTEDEILNEMSTLADQVMEELQSFRRGMRQ
jgi:hypothetical protein